jgi:vacuolar-type H+-ATPase catalytic subunit A/Vma1
MGSLLQEAFLRQSALHPVDAYCSPLRQVRLLRAVMRARDRGLEAIERGAQARAVAALPVLAQLVQAREAIADTALERFDALEAEIDRQFAAAMGEAGAQP